MRCQDTFLARAAGDGVDDLSFAARSGERGALEDVILDGPFVAGLWFIVLEAGGEFVGVVEDVLDRAGHQVSRNLSLAGMA
jgi:hypothetical protein